MAIDPTIITPLRKQAECPSVRIDGHDSHVAVRVRSKIEIHGVAGPEQGPRVRVGPKIHLEPLEWDRNQLLDSPSRISVADLDSGIDTDVGCLSPPGRQGE